MRLKRIMIILIIMLVSSCGVDYDLVPFNNLPQTETNILIELKGEVINPGIYTIKQGTMVFELIELAGGFTSRADTSNFALISLLETNQTIIIPSLLNKGDNEQTTKVSINKATLEQLMTLPGIGKAKAEAIIAYRTEKGSFTKIEDLMKVPGIGEALFNTVKAELIL